MRCAYRHAAALLLALLCTMMQATSAMRVKPSMTSLSLLVRDDEACMYAIPRDFYEGVSMHYHVLKGGDDFDVLIRDPNNKTIYASYAGEHGLEDRVYFTTHTKWEHSFCIDNRGYSKTPKVVKMEIGLTSLKRWKDRIDPLKKVMTRTDGYFLGMHDDQIILRLREQSLREEIERVFTLMTVRGITEALVVIVIALVNVLLISQLFRVKH